VCIVARDSGSKLASITSEDLNVFHDDFSRLSVSPSLGSTSRKTRKDLKSSSTRSRVKEDVSIGRKLFGGLMPPGLQKGSVLRVCGECNRKYISTRKSTTERRGNEMSRGRMRK
jgi:hypothetical protein